MNICMLIDRYKPIFSGHAIMVEELSKEWKKHRINTFIVTRNYNNNPEVEIINGIPIYRFKPHKIKYLGELLFGLRIFLFLLRMKNNFDIIHSNSIAKGYFSSLLFCKFFKKKFIFQSACYGSDDLVSIKNRGRRGRWRYVFLSFIDGYIAISPIMVKTYNDCKFDSIRMVLIPAAKPLNDFYPEANKKYLRGKAGLPVNGKILCFVGSIIKRKGIDILIDAFKMVKKDFPDLYLLLIGPNKFEVLEKENNFFVEEITNKISDYNLEREVIFTGESKEVSNYLKASDIFVFPSRQEGCPAVVIEAMACGLPCIISDMPGISDYLIKDKEEGIIVPQNNPERLAEEVLKLLNDPARANEIGKRAREKALRDFSIEKVSIQYVDFYNKILRE